MIQPNQCLSTMLLAATAALSLVCPAVAFDEKVSKIDIGGRCQVIVTTTYSDGTFYMRDMSCSEWDAVLEYRKERERAKRQIENIVSFEKTRQEKTFQIYKMGLFDHVKAIQIGNIWYPDKIRKAFWGLSEGKTVSQLNDFLKEFGPYPVEPEDNSSLDGSVLPHFIDFLMKKGYGSAPIKGWSNHPYNVCGDKVSAFIIEIEHGGKPIKMGVVWDWGDILMSNEVNDTSTTEQDCYQRYD
ncbi:MAG: hypothetical protein ACO1RX_18365 [Candidatus Sericytochromatia bacterium]